MSLSNVSSPLANEPKRRTDVAPCFRALVIMVSLWALSRRLFIVPIVVGECFERAVFQFQSKILAYLRASRNG